MPNPVQYRRIIAPGGRPSGVSGPQVDTTLEKWSVMHFAQPWWVTISAAPITESDQNMFLGTYAGFDYA